MRPAMVLESAARKRRVFIPYVFDRRVKSARGPVLNSPKLPKNGKPAGSGIGMDSAIVMSCVI